MHIENPLPRTRRPRLLLVGAVALALPLAACAGPGADDAPTSAAESTSATERETFEEATSTPRLALTYDGGIQILDATTLELVVDIPLDGFNRLNGAGDERHAFVSTSSGFQVLDVGTWAEPHGDHAHYYSTEPALLDVVYPAQTPGHVVVHEGRTVLFDDATGAITTLDPAAVADGAVLSETATPTPHHGVAMLLSDDTLVVTEGTEDARTGLRALDATGAEIAASDDCPGVHGETVAEHEAVVVGCEDGALAFHKGEFVKFTSPDDYGRIGNLRGSHDSDLVLGDYGTNPEGGDLTQVAVIDIHDETLRLVDIGAEYTFRSLALDDDGDGLVLAADGAIHVIDMDSAEVVRTIDVIDSWEVPEDWQQPRPTLVILDGSAYVTDPATQRVLAVDIETGEVWNEGGLGVTPNEIIGLTGDVAADEDGQPEDHDDHDHDHDEDH